MNGDIPTRLWRDFLRTGRQRAGIIFTAGQHYEIFPLGLYIGRLRKGARGCVGVIDRERSDTADINALIGEYQNE